MHPAFHSITRGILASLAFAFGFLSHGAGVVRVAGPTAVMEKDGYAFFQLVGDPAPLSYSISADVRGTGAPVWGADYRNLTTSVSLQPWQTPDGVYFELLQDDSLEGAEELVIEFIPRPNETGGYTWPEPVRVRIVDDETVRTPAIEILGPFGLREDVAAYQYEARLNKPAQEALSVQWRLVGGTAVAGQDFAAAEGTLEFPANETAARFQINVLGDTAVEPVETLRLEFFNASAGLFVTAPTIEMLLQDDDRGYRFVDNSMWTDENIAFETVRIQRIGTFPFASTVQVRVEPITAVAGVDYPNEIYTVEFPADESFANLTFRLANDELEDGLKELRLVMINPSNGLPLADGGESMIVRIRDNEFGYAFFPLGDVWNNPEGNLFEGEGGGQYAILHRLGDYVSPSEATIRFEQPVLAIGSPAATAGADFTASSVVVRFAQGERTARVPLPWLDDPLVEGSELVTVVYPQWVRADEPTLRVDLRILDNEFNPLPVSPLQPLGLTAWSFARAGTDQVLAVLVDNRDFNFESTIVRLNANGQLDATFEPVTHPGYQQLVSGPGGELFLLDNPTGGIPMRYRRLNADGMIDEQFRPYEALVEYGVAVGQGGTLFAVERAVPSHLLRVVKLGPDGLPDPAFAPPLINGPVYSLAATPDGGVYVASPFWMTIEGRETTLIKLRADGSVDPSVGSQLFFTAVTMSNGRLYALDGNEWKRLLPTGAIDPTFSPVPGANNRSLLQDAQGRFYQFGFDPGDFPTQYLRRYTADGALDTTYFPGTVLFREEYSASVGPDTSLIVGDSLFMSGEFVEVNGTFISWSQINSARIDLEPGYPFFQLHPDRTALAEASATPTAFTVLRAGNNFDAPIIVRYRLRSGGNVIIGQDIALQEGEITFAAGVSQAEIQLTAINDLLAENDETFYVEFFLPDGTPAGRSDVILESDEMGLTILLDRPSNQISLVGVGLGRGSAMLETSADLIEWTYAGNLHGTVPFPIYPNEANSKRFYRLRR